jgi:Ca2+-binding EF-hand superfamily protein
LLLPTSRALERRISESSRREAGHSFLSSLLDSHLTPSIVFFRMQFAFMLFDEENTGSITRTELVRILQSNHLAKTEAEVVRKADTIMAQCKKGYDDVISFDDFVIVARKFPNILFPALQNRG